MKKIFTEFVREYPMERPHAVSGEGLAATIGRAVGVEVPQLLVEFWSNVGAGYCSDRELYFFEPANPKHPHRSLIGWNQLDSWADLLVAPQDGGPFFFAETCLGDQIGFRFGSDKKYRSVLLAIDTCELFVMTSQFDDLFDHLLEDPHSVANPRLVKSLRKRLGPIPEHSHYAPVVSPLHGGSLTVRNYHIETAIVHIETSIAAWKSLGDS